jgi:hypothetical protein
VLKIRSYPKRSFVAQVKAISPAAVEASQEREVIVRGELGDIDGARRAGMTGAGKILCGKRMIDGLVTRRLIRWLRTEFWNYLP